MRTLAVAMALLIVGAGAVGAAAPLDDDSSGPLSDDGSGPAGNDSGGELVEPRGDVGPFRDDVNPMDGSDADDGETFTVRTGSIDVHQSEGGRICAEKKELDVNKVTIYESTLHNNTVYHNSDDGSGDSDIRIEIDRADVDTLVMYTNAENPTVNALALTGQCIPLDQPFPTTVEAYELGVETFDATNQRLYSGDGVADNPPEPGGLFVGDYLNNSSENPLATPDDLTPNATDLNETAENVTETVGGALNNTTDQVSGAVNRTTEQVDDAAGQVTDTVNETAGVGNATGGLDNATDGVDNATEPVDGAVNETTDGVDEATNGSTEPVTSPVDNTTDEATDAVDGAVNRTTEAVETATNDTASTAGDAVQNASETTGDATDAVTTAVEGATDGGETSTPTASPTATASPTPTPSGPTEPVVEFLSCTEVRINGTWDRVQVRTHGYDAPGDRVSETLALGDAGGLSLTDSLAESLRQDDTTVVDVADGGLLGGDRVVDAVALGETDDGDFERVVENPDASSCDEEIEPTPTPTDTDSGGLLDSDDESTSDGSSSDSSSSDGSSDDSSSTDTESDDGSSDGGDGLLSLAPVAADAVLSAVA